MSALNQHVVASNNQGVGYFQIGDYTCAMMCFKEALETLKQLIRDPEVSSGATGAFLGPQFQWSKSNRPFSSVSAQMKGDAAAYVFERAVTLSFDQANNPEGYYNVDEFAALLYNFGLANHLYCLQNGTTTTVKQLKKALALYNMAISVLQVEGEENPSTPDASLLSVAILNNMGQIQQEFGQYEAARDTYQTLLKQWLLLKREGAMQTVLDESDCNGVFLNLFMYSYIPETAAAA